MANKCNEWECPHNKDGKCDADECERFEDILETVRNKKM
jgi:hypothetical protein